MIVIKYIKQIDKIPIILKQLHTQSANNKTLPVSLGTDTSSESNALEIEVTEQSGISVDNPTPKTSSKDVPAPTQQELQKQASQLKSELVVLVGKRDMTMMNTYEFK